MTPGQAAYEAYATTLCDLAGVGPDSRKPSRWDAAKPQGMGPNEHAAWEAAAQAAIEELASDESWATLAAERDRLRALVEELREALLQGGQDAGDVRRQALTVIERAGFATWPVPGDAL